MSQKLSLNNFKICNIWHVNHFDIIFYQNFLRFNYSIGSSSFIRYTAGSIPES